MATGTATAKADPHAVLHQPGHHDCHPVVGRINAAPPEHGLDTHPPMREPPPSFHYRPTMKTIAALVIACLTALNLSAQPEAKPEAGWGDWHELFDGRTFANWMLLDTGEPPTQGWEIKDGILHKQQSVRGGNLASTGTYDQFELEWEWKISPRGNNGIKYFVVPERGRGIGHEYQMIDDATVGANHATGKTGGFYDILAPDESLKSYSVGDWNHSRIVARGERVQHWLNGMKVLDYQLGSDEVLQSVAKSKFKSVPDFGKRVKGHILLTDHVDEVFYRNIRIRVPLE